MGEFEMHGTAFASTTQAFDSGSSLGKMTMGLLAVFAEFERSQTIDRTIEKIQASRRRGMWTGGNPPMGYDVVDGKLVIDEAAAVVVRDLFAAYLQTGSALKTARLLNERGYRTRRGQPWDKGRVLTALRSPVMCGCINADDEVVEGQHEGIVDRATWDAAQAVLDARPEQDHRQSRNPEYLLAGVVRCGCGAALTPGSAVARGVPYRWYTCVNRAKRGAEGCPSKGWPAEALETFVVERIRSVTADGALAEDVAGRLTTRISERRTAAMGRRRTITGTADRAEREVKRLVDTLADATADARTEVERRLQAQAQARDDARADAQAIDAELATLEGLRVDVAWVAQTLADFDLVWDHLTPLNRQRLVRALVTEVRVDAAAGTMTVALVDLGLEEQRAAS
jgi:site-specific DNA recombinase